MYSIYTHIIVILYIGTARVRVYMRTYTSLQTARSADEVLGQLRRARGATALGLPRAGAGITERLLGRHTWHTGPPDWAADEELKVSYHSSETVLFGTHPCHGNLNSGSPPRNQKPKSLF